MRFNVIHIGKLRSTSLKQEVGEYYKRISRFADLNEVIIPDIKNASSLSPSELKKREASVILQKIGAQEHLILLDENGKEHNSREFARTLEKHFIDIRRPLTFISGGAFGFDESIYKRANGKVSLSKMTFSHQLVRLIFAEQLYRALTIIKGHPYHND